jgi:1-acyl-sn-glycerol-3-phosphate acyltransferase
VNVATNPIQVNPAKTKSAPSGLWLSYFVLSIAAIGAALAYGLVVPLYLLGFLWSPANKAADLVMVRGIRLLMAVQPWLEAEIELDLPAYGQGCLLVSNHRSHLDAFLLLSRVPGVRILAKSSLFSIPFLGLLMRLSKQIPAKAGDLPSFARAMEQIGARAANGETVHVFAEMTRCAPGFAGTQDFSIAPFHAAMRGGFPIIPIAIQGTDEAWPKNSMGIRFGQNVRVRSLGRLDPAAFCSSSELMAETRRRIHQALVS